MVDWGTSRGEWAALRCHRSLLDVSDIKQYPRDEQAFPGIEEVIKLVAKGAPDPTFKSESNLQKVLKDGNHRSADEEPKTQSLEKSTIA